MKATSEVAVDGLTYKHELLIFANVSASKDGRTEVE